jgi:hypothetical protein
MNERALQIIRAIDRLSQAQSSLAFIAQISAPMPSVEAGARQAIAEALQMLDTPPADVEGAGV